VRIRMRALSTVALAAATVATVATAAPAVAGAAPAASGRTLHAIVTVRPGVSLPVPVAGGRVLATFDRVGSEFVAAPASALRQLAADPRVAGVSPDTAGHLTGLASDNSANYQAEGVYASDLLGATPDPTTGTGVNVAVLDSGLTDTPALNRASGRVTDGVDVSTLAAGGDANTSGQFTDGFGHGTFLSTVIAGGPDAGSGGHPLGVAPGARIVVVKVADDQGDTTLSQVLAGLDWVAAHARAIQVVSIALAVDRPTAPAYGADPLTAAIEHVRAAGVLPVVSAGNTPGQVGDPGDDPQALTVGAADLSFKKPSVASFSGSGVVAGVGKPDVVASGVRVYGDIGPDSLVATTHPAAYGTNGLFRGSGTSESTAVTAGVAAAWFSTHPGASPTAAKSALRDAAQRLPYAGSRAGRGLVQYAAGDGSSGNTGEGSFDAGSWQANAWTGVDGWADLLASSWSASSWSASSWSASSWSASSWSASSWSASSWSASSWSASSWSASSWSASSWSASSWSSYGWGS
jgi:serine protease AprX